VRAVQTRDIFVRFITAGGCSVQAVDLNLDRPLGPRVSVTSRRSCADSWFTWAPCPKRYANTIAPTSATAKATCASRSSPDARIC
jgi:hypothetical protein